MTTAIAVLTTVATQADAERIARALVERRLAACVQLSAIASVYRWDGALQQEAEVRLVVKTLAERYDAVVAALHELHPYELPAICALPFVHLDAPFAAWIAASCSG
jgi:periplasmic divalent cation tolerance protein